MGDFVGVDPANLRELAVRLQRLHAVLARHGPAMQQKMQKWGSDLDFTVLPRLLDEALDDARDMEARAVRAYEVARHDTDERAAGRNSGAHRAAPGAVRLDWTATGHSGHQARHDAATLENAITAPDGGTGPDVAGSGGGAARHATDPGGTGPDASALRESLLRHRDDHAYLGAFWAEACPLALQAARSLARRAGAAVSGTGSTRSTGAGTVTGPMSREVFDPESAGILRALGSSLAAATQMRRGTGKDRRPLISDEVRAAVTGYEDPWSVAMLVKYGPGGKTWDSAFLAELTRAMLDAREAGAIDVPLPERTDANGARIAALRAEFDPVVAVMDRASENGRAARHVLGDPATGPRYAAMLVGDDWHTPGPPGERADLSGHAGDFLMASVSAGRGVTEDAKESAWAVVAIARAASAFTERRPEAVLPCGVRAALAFTADRYLPDLAAPRGRNEARLRGGDPPGSWTPHIDATDLARFLGHAFPDPADRDAFTARMDAHRRGGPGE
ncbi:hypothetical protein DQ384_08200 [Sphaerisporangium album]|uniref:Uncharacterized protein n=1 Tax=Sphaerisporangium album TaxID=509200 RepID=A0A367FMQ5_9ACTN|nr:hypothetical protein [Sphaerisporangium album]RCG31551.1 hypothetical protein DQ384_08200 [Sphaerisporangium album]